MAPLAIDIYVTLTNCINALKESTRYSSWSVDAKPAGPVADLHFVNAGLDKKRLTNVTFKEMMAINGNMFYFQPQPVHGDREIIGDDSRGMYVVNKTDAQMIALCTTDFKAAVRTSM